MRQNSIKKVRYCEETEKSTKATPTKIPKKR